MKKLVLMSAALCMMICISFVNDGNAKTASNAAFNPCQTPLKTSVTPTGLLCNGDNNAQATVTVLNGTPPYTYEWSDALAQQTSTATGLSGGLYFVTVVDSNNCPVVAVALINEPSKVVISVAVTNETAAGANDGNASLTVVGGIPPYSYAWSTGETTANIFGKPAGTYSVTVTDANGCQQSANAVIGLNSNPNPPPPCFSLTISGVDASCYGVCDGLASVFPSVPGSYSYIWSTGTSSSIAAGLCAGKHTVTVTNSSNCSVVGSIFIKQPQPLNASATATATLCYDSCDGTATASASGGTLPYSYKWSDPNNQTTKKATGLCAGTYTVTVTDGNNCTAVATAIVNQPPQLQVNLSLTDITCFGAKDGKALLIIKGGTPNYLFKYNKNGGSYSAVQNYNGPLNAGNLRQGIYKVIAMDANGCMASAFDTITQPKPLQLTVTGMGEAPCDGNPQGYAAAVPSGGTPPYTYSWDNGGTTDTIKNLDGGLYKVTVTDANGCERKGSYEVIGYPIELKMEQTNVTCPNGQDGSAKVNVNGGLAPFKYIWSNFGSTTYKNSNLPAGTYCVTVIDANGCSDTACVTITSPPKFQLTLSKDDASCYDYCDGVLRVDNVSGGKPPYSFLWSDGSTGSVVKNVCAGKYKVTVTDQNGCTFSQNTYIIVNQPKKIYWGADISNPTCNGANDGYVLLFPVNAVNPINFWWSGGGNTPFNNVFVGLGAGSYAISITDGNKCPADTIVELVEPDTISYTKTSYMINCSGDSTGVVMVSNLAGGNGGPYTFQWDDPNGQTTSKATGLTAGTYHVTISDVGATSTTYNTVTGSFEPISNICTNVATVVITQKSLNISLTTKDVKCNGDQTGEATVTVLGGNGPYKFLWSNFGSTNNKNKNLPAGSYSVTVSDVNGCSQALNFVINEPPAIVVSLSSDSVSCYGYNDGRAYVNNVVGGKPPYSFQWARIYDPKSGYGPNCTDGSNPNLSGINGPVLKNVCAGIYEVTVTDQLGCTITDIIEIGQPDSVKIHLTVNDISCYGAQDGAAVALGKKGVAPYNYLWSGGFHPTDNQATKLSKGSYYVTVTDNNGCYNIAHFEIDRPFPLKISSLYGTKISCWNGKDGEAHVTVQGGNNGAYYYQWDDPNTQTKALATGLTAGTYKVIIKDSGAISTDSFGVGTFVQCMVMDTVKLVQPEITYTKKDVDCFGAQTGSITVNPGNVSYPVKYIWSNNGSTTNVNSNLPAGKYGLTVVDATGCRDSIVVSINQKPELDFNTSSISTKCYGSSDGELHIVNVTGGKPPYTFLWTGNLAGAHVKGVSAGKYKVTVTDQLGCTATDNKPTIVDQPKPITVKPTIYDVTCNGDKNGAISVNVNGGTPPFIYWWSGGTQVTGDPTTVRKLSPGYYTFSLTDANKCPFDTMFKIIEPDTITLNTEVIKTNCFGTAEGEAEVTASGGNGGPYTYLWDDPQGQTTSKATGLAAGYYNVTVFDAMAQTLNASGNVFTVNCFNTAKVYIPQNNLQINLTGKNVDCYGAQTGSATVTVTGAKGQLKYIWSNFGSVSNSIQNLTAGTYCVTVEDGNGCSQSACVTITQPPALSLVLGTDPTSCHGGSDGRAFVQNITGGKPPYTFVWSNGATGPVAKGLSAGKYKVTATDQNGCTVSTNVAAVVKQPKKINFFALKADVSCYGANDGGIYASPIGGTPPFTYWWSGGTQVSSVKLITSLAPGPYSVMVIDANKCSADTTIEIFGPDSITLTTAVTKVDCNGDATGTASVAASGGNGGPYTYLWDDANGQTASTATGLTSGYYHVTVQDKGTISVNNFGKITNVNCTNTATVFVPQNNLKVTVTTTDVTCYGDQDGSAKATVTGNKGGIKYIWSDYGSVTMNNSGLGAGNYSITVTDGNGCPATASFTINQPNELIATLYTDSVSCFGKSDGEVGVSKVNGGTPPYTFLWSTGATTPVVKGLPANHYDVTVTDQKGCTYYDGINLIQPSQILLLAGGTPATICTPTCNGTASVTVLNGGTYSYMWPNKITSQTLTTLCPGSYTVTVTNSAGCSNSLKVTVGDSCKTSKLRVDDLTSASTNTLDISIFPNPFSDQASLVIMSGEDMDIQVNLYDVNGKNLRSILDQSVLEGEEYRVQIRRDNLPEGIYLYRINSGSEILHWGRLVISN